MSRSQETTDSPRGLRDRVEVAFERWGRTVVARPGRVLVGALVVAAACMAGLPRLTVDVTFDGFLGKQDDTRVAFEAFRERFGRDERLIVAVETSRSYISAR